MSKKLTTALYARLSREDGDKPESCSIETQKRMLTEYAEKNSLVPYRIWVDDGASGKDFERPGFQQMYAEIEKGGVSTLVVTELDRFGRNYLESGLYRETFRKMGVRFISLAENHDSANGENDDFTPFREVINEFYLRQYSKKIKAAFRSRGMAGKHTASSPPYGYLKSPENKNQWIVDGNVSGVVKRIFAMTVDGYGPHQIARSLRDDKVLMPAVHLQNKGTGVHRHTVFGDPYNWNGSTVCSILKKKEYLGHTVNFKSRKESYRDKKNTYVPESEWVIFENTHEPIIDQDTFDTVQRLRANVKRRPDGWGYTHPLTGLLYCADCGAKLYVQRINNGKAKPYYTCYNYRKVPVGVGCPTPHRVDAETVMELLQSTLSEIMKFAIGDRDAFAKLVRERLSAAQTNEVKAQKRRLAQLTKRAADLKVLLNKIYEDYALGKLSEERHDEMAETYSQERADAQREIAELETAVAAYIDGNDRADKFIALIEKYENFDELSVNALNELVEKVLVHERDRKGSMQTTQRIDVYLTFIGNFELPQPAADPAVTAEQEAERRKIEERKDRLHQNYLRRKESGKQGEYDRKYKPLKQARFQERNAAAKLEVAALAMSEGKSPIWPTMANGHAATTMANGQADVTPYATA